MSTKIVLDNKRRGSFGPEFEPGDLFVREVNGEMVTFRKVAPPQVPLLRARKVKGRWVGAAIRPSRQAIVDALRNDRESR